MANLIGKCIAACRYGNFDYVKKYVENGVDINGEHDGVSPFRVACENGCHEIVEYLIESGVNIFCPNNDGNTGLMFASQNGHAKIVESLLAHHPSLDFIRFQNNFGNTALMYASKEGHEDVVKQLLLYDPSEEHIMIKNKRRKTAIDFAKTDGIKELLISAPAVNSKRAKPSN